MEVRDEARILTPVLAQLLEEERDSMLADVHGIVGRALAKTVWSALMHWLPVILEKCLYVFMARYGQVTIRDIAELMIQAFARMPPRARALLPPPPPVRN
jgi:hypothetical protein